MGGVAMGLITAFVGAFMLSLLGEWCSRFVSRSGSPFARSPGRSRGRAWLLRTLFAILIVVVYIGSTIVLGVLDVANFPAVEVDSTLFVFYFSGMLAGQYGWRPLMERIRRTQLRDYRDRLVAAVEASGTYAGLTTEPHRGGRRVHVYGVGDAPPASVAEVIDEAPDILEVVWHPAPYTHAELVAERDRVMDRFPQLYRGRPTIEGTRLEFGTTDPELLAAPDGQAALGSRYPAVIVYGEPVS